MREKKTFKMQIKDLDEKEGIFIGHASVFGNVDQGGDIVESGAFNKTLNDNPGRKWPLLWRHNDMVGHALASQDEKGLSVEGHLNLDVEDARAVMSLMVKDGLRGMSFGYEPIIFDYVGNDQTSKYKDARRVLREVKLYEVTLTPFPMNEAAGVDFIKELFDGNHHDELEKIAQQLLPYLEKALGNKAEKSAPQEQADYWQTMLLKIKNGGL